MISAKIGLRNLARNRWRSGLTLGGIALSVAFMVWILGFMEGWLQQMVQGATAVSTGQVQVSTAAYVDNPRIYRSFETTPELLETIRGVSDVEALSPRVILHGLVGHERKSQVARILGVDPEMEAEATPVPRGVEEGRWLAPDPPEYPAPRQVVLGADLARQLAVGPGDELVVFAEAADGSLGNDLLEVVGTVRTGNSAVDRMTVYMHLEDARFLAALEGEAHEILVRTSALLRAREVAGAVADALGAATRGVREGDGEGREVAGAVADSPGAADSDEPRLLVRPWQEVLPAVYQMLALSRQSNWMMYLLVYLVAAVGIVNTQRMSALERRREFGVLLAIGMRPRRMFRMVLAESLVLGTLGAVLGTALGTLVTWYHATAGMDLSLFTEHGEFTFMGVAFSGRMYTSLTLTAAVQPVVVMLVVAFLAGIWPAVKSARLDPAPTIAGRQ